MSLATRSAVKTVLSIPAGVTFHDAGIDLAVASANAHVLRRIGQPDGLVATTRTDYPRVYTESQQDVYLKRAPVVSVIAATNAGTALVEGVDFRADQETGLLRLTRGTVTSRGILASWSTIPDDVVVTYLHGFTDATVPDHLVQAANLIAAATYQRNRSAGLQSSKSLSYQTTPDGLALPPEAALVLSSFEDAFHH